MIHIGVRSGINATNYNKLTTTAELMEFLRKEKEEQARIGQE